MQKRIGFDARFYNRAGPGRYTKALLDHLEIVDKNNKYLVFLTKEGFDLYQPKNANFEKVLETEERTWHSRIEGLGFPAKCVPEAEIEFPRHVANENGDNASTGSLKTVYKGYTIRQTHCLVDSPAILPRHALYRRQCEPRTNQLGSSVFSLGGISR